MFIKYVAEVRFSEIGWVTIPEEFATRGQADMRALDMALRMNGQETRVVEVPDGEKVEA